MKTKKSKSHKRSLPGAPSQIVSRFVVLSSTELLESIFLKVDMQALLISVQRVCSHWRDIIANSPSLQRQLFFLADPDTSGIDDPPKVKKRLVQNPLLITPFRPLFYSTADIAWWAQYGHARHYLRAHELGLTFAPDFELTFQLKSDNLDSLDFTNVSNGKRRHLAFVRAGASWRKMLVSQPPPVRVARIDLRDSNPPPSSDKLYRYTEIPGGLRMGELWDAVYSTMWGGKKIDYSLPYANVGWRVSEDMRQEILDRIHKVQLIYGERQPSPRLRGEPFLDERTDLFIAVANFDFERETWESRYPYGPHAGHHGRSLPYRPIPEPKYGYLAREEHLRQRERTSSKWMYLCEE
ncbi:hypothetical protein B0H67DRAFT_642741 [Lasiosphaeris hirsuta]|uniref:F-box domain-containing protein n=1 Tax=Lasiosphaeris hirsuta TaxID=260670 RepID=A0AA40AP31_9PEZI|nr:hypothetical protein B0H67DRAFT_642741 [Lasiosphaeris hirsuta]